MFRRRAICRVVSTTACNNYNSSESTIAAGNAEGKTESNNTGTINPEHQLNAEELKPDPPYPIQPPLKTFSFERRSIGDLIRMGMLLGKARLGSVVVATTALGFLMAPIPLGTLAAAKAFCLCSTGTALAVLSANSGNQILEREVDKKMNRTRNRLLPTNTISVGEACAFFALTGTLGPLLVWQVDHTAALLALGNIGLYVGVYTPLKRIHPINTWVGAIVGGIPPMIGWTAATGGEFGPGAWIVAALLYLWQMPHFLALSYPLRHDYARGGFRMLSNIDPARLPNQVILHSLMLSALPFISVYYNLTTPYLLLDSGALNIFFTYICFKFKQDLTDASAWRVFRHSIWYILAVSALFLIHRIPPTDNDVDDVPSDISRRITEA